MPLRFRRAVLLAALTLIPTVAAQWDLWPAMRGPHPPEWQWGFVPKLILRRSAPVLGVSTLLLGLLAFTGTALARRAPRRAAAATLLGATVLGWSLQLALLHLEPAGALTEMARRTLSASFTSYHRAALTPMAENVPELLATYPELLPIYGDGAVHAATHPPGPVLYYRALFGLSRHAPRLAGWLVERARGLGLDVSALDASPSAPALCAALLGAGLFGLMGAATCVPVALLARGMSGDSLAAARTGVLWTVVPGLVLMVPELDQALALPVAGMAAALWAALSTDAGRHAELARAVAAGVLAGLAAFLSYGALLFVAAGALAVLAALVPAPSTPRARAVRVLAWTGAAALAILLLPVLFGYRPLATAVQALTLHRERFTAPRSYVLWLLFNPLDLALFLGLPLAGLAGLTLVGRGAGGPADRFCSIVLATTGAWLVSGTVRGEVGRIALPLMPLLLLAALSERLRPKDGGPAGPTVGTSVFLAALLIATDILLRRAWQIP